MKHFKYYYFILLLLATAVSAQESSSQTTIKGTICDAADNKFLPGSAVVLEEKGSIIKSVLADSLGKFALTAEAGNKYTLKITCLGYAPYLMEFTANSETPDLGRIMLSAEGQLLEEVTIKASGRKPVIQSKADRIIYNASSDISNKAGTAADVLRKAPMLTVNADGELKMRGSSSIKVLLNGVPSGILAKNLKEALKTIPAASIQSVEVITSPSSKYEAEGSGGVINIITKKKLKGTSGTLDMAAGNLEQSSSLTLGKFSEKYDISLQAGLMNGITKGVYELNRRGGAGNGESMSLLQESGTKERDGGAYVGITVAYKIDTLQRIEVSGMYWRGMWPKRINLRNILSSGDSVEQYTQHSHNEGSFNSYEFSMGYQKKFERVGQELHLTGQVSLYDDVSSYKTNRFSMLGVPLFSEHGPNNGKGNEYSIQADYSHPLSDSGSSTFETGLKYLSGSSNTSYTVSNTDFPSGDPARSNAMKHFQNVFSAYGSLQLFFGDGWSLKPGIRFENTNLKGSFQTAVPSFGSNYSNLVSSVLLTKEINDAHQMKLNFSERIRRPWIWDMNPFVDASDPNNLRSGNPALRPELTRTAELGHTYSSQSGLSLTSSIYFKGSNNAMESVTTVNENGRTHTNTQNIGSNSRIGASVNLFFKPLPKWSVTSGADLYQIKFESDQLKLSNKGAFVNLSFNTSFELGSNYSLQASGDYSNGAVTLQGNSSYLYSYRFSARRELLRKKASLTLTACNPFQQEFRQTGTVMLPAFQDKSVSRYFNRSVILSFSWQFGIMRDAESQQGRFSGQDENTSGLSRKK